MKSMIPLELHPEFLVKGGRREFAVLPYDEYERLAEFITDMEDLLALREAKEQGKDEPGYALEEVKKQLGIE